MARSRSARAGGIQMTEGPLYKNILLFSVPLIFSQLLQVLFNMADVAVVGKFSSATALGSVGSTSTLVTLFTGFLIGLSNGVNVRVAQYLGAKQEEDTRNCAYVFDPVRALRARDRGAVLFPGRADAGAAPDEG